MVTVCETVYVDVEASEFKDDDLIEELESRGYTVFDGGDFASFVTAVDALRQGRKEEGFILLERAIPELKGLLIKG